MSRRAVAVGLGALVITTVLFVFANTAHAAQGGDAHVAPSGVYVALPSPAASESGFRSQQPGSAVGEGCTVSNVVVYGSGKRATFTVAGDCVVSLVSYERHGNGLAGQTLFDSSAKEFTTGAGELRITVPDCAWQVDLVLGQPRNPPTDYGNNVLGFRFGGEGQCPTPTTTTTVSAVTTTTTTSTSTPTTSAPPSRVTSTSTTANPSSTSTPTAVIGTRSTRTDLAHTGSESLPVIALGALGLIGAGRYVEQRGKRRAS